MKPLVIYHANCADGFGAAFTAWLKLGDKAEYVPMQYGDTDTRLEYTGRELYILDFSFPREVMDHMFANAKRVVWLDHHKTAFEMWCEDGERNRCEQSNGRDEVLLDNNKSGAMLAWRHFHPGKEVPMLVKHIDDYDRWQFKLEDTKAFNKALWSFTPWTFEHWKGISKALLTVKGQDMFRAEGLAVLRAHEQNVQAVVKGAVRTMRFPYLGSDVNQKWGLAANCPPHLASDVGHSLATQSGTFGLLWYINKEGKCLCSLRSNGDYDVSVIAKAFGGGGHKNAAGFEVDVQALLNWIT